MCKTCSNHNNCFTEYRPSHGCAANGCRCGAPKVDYCWGERGHRNGWEDRGYRNGWDGYRADRSYWNTYGRSGRFDHPKNPVYGGYYNYNGIPNIATRSDYFTTF